jgi:hypothetical protein
MVEDPQSLFRLGTIREGSLMEVICASQTSLEYVTYCERLFELGLAPPPVPSDKPQSM